MPGTPSVAMAVAAPPTSVPRVAVALTGVAAAAPLPFVTFASATSTLTFAARREIALPFRRSGAARGRGDRAADLAHPGEPDAGIERWRLRRSQERGQQRQRAHDRGEHRHDP